MYMVYFYAHTISILITLYILSQLCRDELHVSDLFPPSSDLFGKLFHLRGNINIHEIDKSDIIPSFETVIDIIDDCWVHNTTTSMTCGVLFLTSHRVIFIEASSRQRGHTQKYYPEYFDRLSLAVSMFFIPIAKIATVTIRRFLRKNCHGLDLRMIFSCT